MRLRETGEAATTEQAGAGRASPEGQSGVTEAVPGQYPEPLRSAVAAKDTADAVVDLGTLPLVPNAMIDRQHPSNLMELSVASGSRTPRTGTPRSGAAALMLEHLWIRVYPSAMFFETLGQVASTGTMPGGEE